jgi:hypothetical protein
VNPYLDALDEEEKRVQTTDSPNGAPAANPYLDTLESDIALEKAQRRATLQEAVRTSPDEASDVARLRKRYPAPDAVLLRNLQDVKLQEAVDVADERLVTSPALATKMRDMSFARVAHDDLEGLSAVEHAIGFMRSVPAGAARGVGSVVSGAGEILDIGARNLDRVYRGMFGDRAADMLWFDLGPNANSALNPAAALKTGGSGWKMIAEAVGVDKKDRNFLTDVGEGIGQLFQQIAFQVATGGTSSVFSLYAQGVDAMADKTAQDDVPQAAKDAAMIAGGAATAAAEKLGVDALLNRVPPRIKNDAIRWVADKLVAAGIEASTEIAEGVLQDVVRKALTNPDALIGEGIAYEAGVAGTAAALVRASFGARRRQNEVERANRTAKVLTDVLKAAEGTKLRERSPEAFSEAVQEMAEQQTDAPTEVFIDAKALIETLAQSGMTPEQIEAALPSAASQLAEASTAGGDVAVPVGEFTALAAGSGLEQALVEHVRLSPEALSQADAKLLAGVDLQAEVARLENAADADLDAQATSVRSQVMAQLDDAGRFSPAVNAAYADSVAALFETQAARLGVTPAELWARYTPTVRAEITPGAALEQEAGGTSQAGAITRDTLSRERFDQTVVMQPLVDGARPDTENGADVFEGVPLVTQSDGALDRPSFLAVLAHVRRAVLNDPQVLRSVVGAVPVDVVNNLAGSQTAAEQLLRDHPVFKDGTAVDADLSAAVPVDATDPASLLLREVARATAEQGRRARSTGREAQESDSTARTDEGDRLRQDDTPSQPRATFTPSTNTITLLARTDLTSFHHELAHFYLEMLADMAAQPDAPAAIVEDMQTVLAQFGPDMPIAQWRALPLESRRDMHEKFALGYEAYLFEGKSPSTALAAVFSRFSEWMRRVYKSIRDLDVELNDDIRRVYDRMLASEDAIKEVEAARAYAPLFADAKGTEKAGVDTAAYHALGAEATAEAVDQLQARSMRDMRWLSNAKGRALKALQKDAATTRKVIEDQVRDEVGRMPVYAAENFLRRGVLPEADRSNTERKALDATQGMNTKLDLATLKEIYGEDPAAPWRYLPTGKFGMATTKDGLHPDTVADIFGFPSGDALVRELLAAEPQAQVIEGMTDQRMLEEHGELSSADALERAAEEAVHNEARGRFIATELAALDKALGPARVLVAAAKQFAEAVIGAKVITTIRPRIFVAAETRAAKAAQKALGKSTEDAATAKRNQLLNHYAARYAADALREVERTQAFFRKVANTPDDKLKSRDIDVVNAARAVLAAYGIGRRGEAASAYLDSVAAYDPDMSKVLRAAVDGALANAKPFEQLTLTELRALNDEMGSLWHLAKRSRQMEVDGDLMDREEVQDELKARMDEIGIPDRVPGEGSAVTPGETRLAKLRSFVANAIRVESWVSVKDGGRTGPFRRFVWNQIRDAADAYRGDKVNYLKQFRALLDPIAPTLKSRLIDARQELGYTFGKDTGGVALVEILHAIGHTGNASNKRKLLLGRKWATENADGTLDTSRWDAFIGRMVSEGVLTKAHFDFVQGLWDLMDQMKPLAQKTHRDVFGKYFNEITAETVNTPFGQYRGGYLPATTDPRLVTDAAVRQLMEDENASMQFSFPTTNRGFAKDRTEYNKPLLLDLKALPKHIDKVLLFSHMERPVRDVRRVLTSKGVAYGLNRLDPQAFGHILTPWLNRAARQEVETPMPAHWAGWRFWSVIRARAGMAAMFANVVNTAQQISGFASAALRVKPRYLLRAMVSYGANPRQTSRTVAAASPYMAGRMYHEVSVLNDSIREVMINPSAFESAQAFASRHAYFMQAAIDNVMSPIIWTGAYNQALEQGLGELDARRQADSAVRETQGSTMPEDISNWEGGPAFARLFSQFAGWFNTQANLLGTEFANIPKEMGLAQKSAKGLYIFTLGFLAQAIISEAIVQGFRGGPDDEDRDGEYWDDWLAALGFGTLRMGTAMIPVAGQGINAIVNATNNKPYDDRIGTSPAISMLEASVRGGTSVAGGAVEGVSRVLTGKKLLNDDELKARDVLDVATLVSMSLGLPVNAAAKPLAYATEVNAGRVRPEGPADTARGLITGRPSYESKR